MINKVTAYPTGGDLIFLPPLDDKRQGGTRTKAEG